MIIKYKYIHIIVDIQGEDVGQSEKNENDEQGKCEKAPNQHVEAKKRENKQKKINSQELDGIFPSSFDDNDEVGIFSPSLVDEVIFSPYIVFGF